MLMQIGKFEISGKLLVTNSYQGYRGNKIAIS